MAVAVANVLTGTPTIYTAPVGEAIPELNDLNPPAVTITPAGNWSLLGYTIEDWALEYEPDLEIIEANEDTAPIKRILVAETLKFKIKVIETDFRHLAESIPYGGTVTVVSAGADQTEQDQIAVGSGTLTEVALLILATSPEAGSRVIHIPKAVATGGMALTWKKNAASDFDIEWEAVSDSALTAGERMARFYDITAVASS